MTKSESRKGGSAPAAALSAGRCGGAAEQVNNGSLEPSGYSGCPDPSPPVKARVLKQTSKESLHRRNTECEVFDDGTITFFW